MLPPYHRFWVGAAARVRRQTAPTGSTILSYLKSHTSYLGLKQQRFDLLLANGSPDYYYETVNGQQVRKQNVTRPQALCFDYLRIKDDFGVSLETEAMTDAERLAEDYESAAENHPGDSMNRIWDPPLIYSTTDCQKIPTNRPLHYHPSYQGYRKVAFYSSQKSSKIKPTRF